MPNTEWTPATRYHHDADELTRLAEWLDDMQAQKWALRRPNVAEDAPDIAADYFRLADRLAQLADDAREFARAMGGPLP